MAQRCHSTLLCLIIMIEIMKYGIRNEDRYEGIMNKRLAGKVEGKKFWKFDISFFAIYVSYDACTVFTNQSLIRFNDVDWSSRQGKGVVSCWPLQDRCRWSAKGQESAENRDQLTSSTCWRDHPRRGRLWELVSDFSQPKTTKISLHFPSFGNLQHS